MWGLFYAFRKYENLSCAGTIPFDWPIESNAKAIAEYLAKNYGT